MKKVIAIVTAAVLVMALNTGTCFAGEATGTNHKTEAGSNTVHAVLNLAPTSIDFNISENIYLTGEANKAELTCTDLMVVNNLHAGSIQVVSVTASGNSEAGWTISEFESTKFAALPLNSKMLGLKCEGVDMAGGGSYGPTAAIAPLSERAIKFEAQTGATSETISNVVVANVIATVAMVDTTSTIPQTPQNS